MMAERKKWMEGYELLRYDKAQELYEAALADVVAVVNHMNEKLVAGEISALARLLSVARVAVYFDGDEHAENRKREYTGAVSFLWMAWRIKDATKYALTDLLDDSEAVEGLLAAERSKGDA